MQTDRQTARRATSVAVRCAKNYRLLVRQYKQNTNNTNAKFYKTVLIKGKI